jgi:DNA-binding transcriptional regulator PaaX
MKAKNRAKYGALTALVLKLVAGGVFTGLAGLSHNPSKVKSAVGGLADYGEEQIRKCLIYLRMQKYIAYESDAGRSVFVITKDGLKKLNKTTLHARLLLLGKKRWDRLWRIVAFDVPENRKSSRDLFRRDLIRLGFFPFQKSIYATPFPCEKEIGSLANKRGISRYVLVSVTPSLGWREAYALRWFSEGLNLV